MDTLDTTDLQILAGVYRAIVSNGHNSVLSKWLNAATMEDKKFGVYWKLAAVYFIFDLLADREMPPFNKREVSFIEK